jgi:hypothetical protein
LLIPSFEGTKYRSLYPQPRDLDLVGLATIEIVSLRVVDASGYTFIA